MCASARIVIDPLGIRLEPIAATAGVAFCLMRSATRPFRHMVTHVTTYRVRPRAPATNRTSAATSSGGATRLTSAIGGSREMVAHIMTTAAGKNCKTVSERQYFTYFT
jgi:hypothetical protein